MKLERQAEKPRGSDPLWYMPVLHAERKVHSSAVAKAVTVDAVAHCMCPGVVLSWEAFNAAVVDFHADQARRHRTRRFAAASVETPAFEPTGVYHIHARAVCGITAPCSWPARQLEGERVCFVCGLHRSGTGACCSLSPHGVGHKIVRCTWVSSLPPPLPLLPPLPPDLPGVAAIDLHVCVRCVTCGEEPA